MAKLPPKPLNPVHEFFPVGADGQSPMNYGPKQVKESDKPEEIANKYSLGGESLLNKTDYYSENPIVDDPDNPGKKIRKKDLEARQKSQRVEVGKGSSNELDEVVLTPNNKIVGIGNLREPLESPKPKKKSVPLKPVSKEGINRGKKKFMDKVNKHKNRWK